MVNKNYFATSPYSKGQSTVITSTLDKAGVQRYGGGGSGGKDKPTPEATQQSQSIADLQRQAQQRAAQEEAARQEAARQQALRDAAQQQKIITSYAGGQRGTRTDLYNQPIINQQDRTIYRDPTIIRRQTGVVPGTDIPTTQVIVRGGGQSDRTATVEEEKLLEEKEKALTTENTIAPTGISRIIDTSKTIYNINELGKQEFISPEFEDAVATLGGKGAEVITLGLGKITGSETITGSATNVGGFVGGIYRGIIPTTKREAVMDLATLGIGYGVGFGVKGVSALAFKIPKYGSYVSSGVKGATFIGGGILTTQAVGTKLTDIYSTKSASGKGEIVGSTLKEFGLFGYGYKEGELGFTKARGWYQTRGLTEIPAERLIPQEVLSGKENFPTAPKGQQYKLFQGTKYKYSELTGGNKPGGFHASPGKILTEGKITPGAGTSELPGLYVSSFVSPYFTKLSGKSSSKFNLPNIKSIISPETSPSITFFRTEGFRVSPFAKTKPYVLDGTTFNYKFIKSTKPGVGDIPLMKTEIEAVLRPESGTFVSQPRGYYTEISNVKVPIDVVNYETGSGITGKAVYTKEPYIPKEPTTIYYPTSTSYTPTSTKVSILNIKDSSYIDIPPSKVLYSPPPSSGKYSGGSSSSYIPPSSPSSLLVSSYSPSSKVSSKVSKVSYSPSSYFRKSSYKPSSSYSPYKKKSTPYKPFKLPGIKLTKSQGKFQVFGRRFGKFKLVGIGRTEKQAFSLGKKFARTSLGVTFKVPESKITKLPGYKTKVTKQGTLFVEPLGKRLKRGSGEIPEIKFYKGLKGGRKK